MKIIDKIKNKIQEIILEGKKITWPTKNETIKFTLIVIVISIIFSVVLGFLDFIYIKIISKLVI
jgi:preprotein translocase subunit SecE